MSDLISKAELFNALATAKDKADCFAVIQAAPTVDAVPVSVIESWLRELSLNNFGDYILTAYDPEKVVLRGNENCPGCEHTNDWCPGCPSCSCCDYDHKGIDEFPCSICSHNGGSENLWQHTIPIGAEIIELEY